MGFCVLCFLSKDLPYKQVCKGISLYSCVCKERRICPTNRFEKKVPFTSVCVCVCKETRICLTNRFAKGFPFTSVCNESSVLRRNCKGSLCMEKGLCVKGIPLWKRALGNGEFHYSLV